MGVQASVSVNTYATVTQTTVGNFTGRLRIEHEQKRRDVTKAYGKSLSGTTSIDLTSLTDSFGAVLAFASVFVVHVLNNDPSNPLVVTGTVLGSDQYTVGPGKSLFIDTTRTVSGGHTGITFTGTGVAFDVIVLGA